MDAQSHLKIARSLTELMDSKFGIGKFKIGFDPLIGAIPGIGDVITTALSIYIVWIGIQLKLPQEKVGLMIGNIAADFLISVVPVVGDIADVFYKANSRNMRILEDYLEHVVEGQVVK